MKVYENELEGSNRRGRPLGIQKDTVEEYLRERGVSGKGVFEQQRESWDNER